MVVNVSAYDLRYHLKSVMDAVQRGEDVYITSRGRIKARIVPVDAQERAPAAENPFVGMWRDQDEMKDVRAYVRRLRKGRTKP